MPPQPTGADASTQRQEPLGEIEDGTQGIVYIGQFSGGQMTDQAAEPLGIDCGSLLYEHQGRPTE